MLPGFRKAEGDPTPSGTTHNWATVTSRFVGEWKARGKADHNKPRLTPKNSPMPAAIRSLSRNTIDFILALLKRRPSWAKLIPK
jgi:hypothetical protein